MANEYSPQGEQDLNSLTSSIIPSNSYFNSWNNSTERTPRADNELDPSGHGGHLQSPAFQAGFNLFSPQGTYPPVLGVGNQAPLHNPVDTHNFAYPGSHLQGGLNHGEMADIHEPKVGLTDKLRHD